MSEPMDQLPLVGRGRAADVFDAGGGRVLRRYRTARADSVGREALAMRHLREHGAPVPEVFSAEGTDMVMERLDGPTMLAALKTRPWRARAIGRELRALHTRLHSIPAGDIALPRFSDGDAILHLDLHPDNVMLTDAGPMIIDWSNVALGDPLADVMNTWMLMVTSSPDHVPVLLRPLERRVRRNLTGGFIEGTPIDDAARRWIGRVCEQRLRDPNAHDHEKARVRAFAAEHGVPLG
jgi:aminoglycoside phosphotransferase (APT) family kinase protein